MALSLGAALGLAGGTSLISGITNYLTGKSMMNEQSKYAKEMFDYQWNKAYSPQAQVKNMAAAGINPAAQLGSHSVLAGSPQASMPSMPSVQYGITGLSDLSQYISANAQDKKTGADVGNINQDTQLKKIQSEAEAWKLGLAKQFGSEKMAADLALAQQNVRLAELSGDEKQKDIAIKQWTEAKEKAMSQCAEKNRDILQKELDNKDTELKLRNEESRQRAAASKASASASYASAEASRAHAHYMDALTTTEDAMRQGKVKVQQLSIDLQDLAKQMANRENIRDAATHEDKIHAIVTQCNAQGLINEKMQREIEHMITENDWQSVQYAMGCLGQAVGMYTSVGNLSLNQLTSQQRLDIQRDFNRIYEQGQHHKTVNYKPDEHGNWKPVWKQEQ